MAALRNNRPRIFAVSPWAAKAILGGIIVALALLASVTAGSRPAHAQQSCDVRKTLLAKLDTGYDEQPVAIGVASTGNVVELLVSANGTWTILVTRPNGIACIAAVGEDWQALDPHTLDESS